MIPSLSPIKLGVCPTHLKFVGGLVPDENGRLPRNSEGQIKISAGLKRLTELSPVTLTTIQISLFSGAHEDDVMELMTGIRDLGISPDIILMIGGVEAANPADEDEFVRLAVEALGAAKKLGIESVASTSFEDWMNTNPPKEGADYDAAVAQVIKAHLRAYKEADLANSAIISWDLEFLRPSEFTTFTNIRRAWDVVRGLNESLGSNFFRVLVDAAHCGDSGLSMAENQSAIQEIAAAGGMGAFHASAKTTRGCHTSDDGWISTLLSTCAETGALNKVIVEAFHHEDDALAALRESVPGHGVDTRDGRSYDQLIVDGLVDVTRRLNNLVARGKIAGAS